VNVRLTPALQAGAFILYRPINADHCSARAARSRDDTNDGLARAIISKSTREKQETYLSLTTRTVEQRLQL